MRSPARAWRPGVWAVVGQVVVIAASAGRGVMLARMLDPADLGRLFLLLSGAVIAVGVGLTGFAVTGLRRVAASDSPEAASRTIRGVAQLVLVANAALLILTALVREPAIIDGDYHIHWLEQYLASGDVKN